MLFLAEQKYLPIAQQIGAKYNVDPTKVPAPKPNATELACLSVNPKAFAKNFAPK